MKALLCGLCLAAVVVPAARAAPPPPELIGTWTRTVSAEDIARAHATSLEAGRVWTLVITNRKSVVRSPGAAGYAGAVVPSSATQVHFELGGDADLYTWRRIGKTLSLVKYVDPDAKRAAILAGVWKRG